MKQGDGKEPERFQKLVTLFNELHEKREAEWAPIIEETRASDPDLAAELERMLKEEDALEGFLENPPLAAFHSSVPEVSPGDTVGHYRILSLLGSGGMGIVYCAEDSRLNRRVALKFLAPHLVGYGQNRERFVKEAQAAAALRHPNVCPVYEIGETDGRAYIVMALLEGETLAQRIAAGPMPARETVALALEIATGLEAAHAKGIVHHDVKPANLMITRGSDGQNHATLMDFGLAQMMDLSHHTSERWLAGTISYMSPERVAGSSICIRWD
jgi:serine/threonine protein kinase